MNDLEKDFLRDSSAAFSDLRREAEAENFSETKARESLRLFHSFKGTAQAFNFGFLSVLAHEIENLLEAARDKKIASDKNFKTLFLESLDALTQMCGRKIAAEEINFPRELIEKIKRAAKVESKSENFTLALPAEILAKLSNQEKARLAAAIENRKNLFVIEIGFEFENFETDFKRFKNSLDETGNIEATFPGAKFIAKLGFQFFLTTEKSLAEVAEQIRDSGAEINFQVKGASSDFSNENESLLMRAVESAKKLAIDFKKKIEFDVSLDETRISAAQTKILFDAVLHLTRNAVDHGIAEKGKICVRLERRDDSTLLIVADDGRGIDFEKIRAKAAEKNLTNGKFPLNEAEICDLIFAHGVSTAEKISPVSGRGVGLDAVKNAVETAGGKITVASESGKGTRFEIYLPNE